MWGIGLLMMACEPSTPETEESESPFRTACMGGGTPEQQITAKALLEFVGETKCYAAWKKLSERSLIDLESHAPPISDISVLEGLTQLEALFIGDSLIPDIDVVHDFVNLKDLRINHTEISDLQPLSKLTKLETLIIDQTEVQDLKALEGLSSLKKLSLRNTKVSSLSTIQKLTELEYLDASKTQIVQLEGIDKLTALKILSLRGTPVQELKPLETLSSLRYLDLYETSIVSIRSLEKMSSLEVLDISFTDVSDLSPLSALSALQEFKAERIPLDVSTCPEQPEIVRQNCQPQTPLVSPFLMACLFPERTPIHTSLTIENLKSKYQAQDCPALYETLKQQSQIQMTDSAVYDVNLFSEFNAIETIDLNLDAVHPSYCPQDSEQTAVASLCGQLSQPLPPNEDIITECTQSLESQDSASPAYIALIDILSAEDCSGLSSLLPQIDAWTFELLELSDISPLRHAKNLRELYLGENNIQDISSLSELQKLQILWLDSNQIQDISPLSNGSFLWLGLGDNHITDITPLKDQTQLIYLWLGGNQIQDLSPLANHTRLRKLHLAKNKIQDIQALSTLPQLNKVYLADNQIKDPSPLLNTAQLRLLNEGLDDQESPLEAARWFLTNNPIDSAFCETESLPFLFQFYCSTTVQ